MNRNPSPATRFKPGRINKGRPKGSGLTDELKKLVSKSPEGSKLTYKELLARNLIKLALEGNMQANMMVWDRLEGPIIQKSQHTGENDGPIKLIATLKLDT